MSKPFHALTLPAVLALALAGASASFAQGAPVLLRAKAGGLDFSGQLQSFDGKAFVIESAMGTLTLDAAQYDCQGTGCPGTKVASATPAGAASPAEAQFGIHGSNTIGSGLMPRLIRGYADSLGATVEESVGARPREITVRVKSATAEPLARIDLQRYGSATAFPALQSGVAQLGMADRGATAEELSLGGVQEHVIGLDGVAVIVPKDSGLASLTLAQLAGIFSGEITDWSALGMPPGLIRPIAPDAGHGTLDIFLRLVMKRNDKAIGPYVQRMDGNGDITDAVLRDPRAIGVTSAAYLRTAKVVSLQGTCGIVTAASPFTIKSEDYPLARRLNVYTRGTPTTPFAQGLLRFALSPPAQQVVSDAGFTDQAIIATPFATEEARFSEQAGLGLNPEQWQRAFAPLTKAERLSATFRFAPGSSELLPRSRQDLVRLADMLRANKLKGKTIMLVGFADAVGTPSANTALSLKRAAQIRAALLALAGLPQTARNVLPAGLGQGAPVACNDTAEGQQLNRRVEVWVRD